ncbi:DNA-directed RNA polymerase I subunit RPA12 [Belonocnema kinseyi]|uniref:DNA-directed RNA polymerase I subunit RPA12 n=1 Tax=Belonocnema kinseyi TaxID=2817044 RepID=UPI00143D56EF|nr:DNA-directed RNA polymerase I subunit RPA12 [Belonocnema kinseyi]
MEFKKESGSFSIAPGFCPDCGTILPLCPETGAVTCYSCERSWDPEKVFGSMEMSYRIPFIDRKTCETSKRGEGENEEKPDGPIVERQCPQCKNDKMSYATLQLRSADEGQTVFFTCTKCKFKETENS